MRPKDLGSCTDKRFERWSWPSLSFVGAPLNSGVAVWGLNFRNPVPNKGSIRGEFRGWPTGRELRAEGAMTDFELPEMVHATFYTMLLNEAIALGVARDFMAEGLKSALVGLRWSSFEVWMSCVDHELREAQLRRAQGNRPADSSANLMLVDDPSRGRMSSFPSFRGTVQAAEYIRDNLRWSERETSSLHPNLLPWNFSAYCPEFNHIVAMQFAHATHIPDMVQAVFYVMVINDAVRLRFIRREIGENLMSNLQKLRWDVIEAWLLFIEDKLKDARR
ncbi:hypothetical protein Cgig2_030767 [Carnegiea gigantea]|uniref:Uncharacterized protein n=1 Tax=Carnegiea gigantea TaxID=171969 RepID=A0A9Q1KU70_9CARY|nr:hypothetical protein Cgig2_030767 [Carnegiea gigantea]